MKHMPSYLKLTLGYMAIVMMISLFFSVIIYQVSSAELDRGFRRQPVVFQTFPDKGIDFDISALERARTDRINEINHNLQLYLFYLNLIILVIAGLGSYFLAKRTLEPIEKMAELQGRFTADASHELRTPLTAMKSEIEVLLRDKNITLSEAKDLLRSNLEEIEKLKNLSTSLLNLARYKNDAETATLTSAIFLPKIIEEARDNIAKIAAKRNIEIAINLDQTEVIGDEKSLIELFTILLDNATKYSPDHSKISITSKNHFNKLEVRIRDEGVGISKKDLPNIFNRFYRADLSRSDRNVSGHGLGLSIASRIAEINQCSISVQSEEGKGSTFSVILHTK
jgi:signal transduction histidine kinase